MVLQQAVWNPGLYLDAIAARAAHNVRHCEGLQLPQGRVHLCGS
jgi:hypothetical protein